jgi:hypothetical protein
MSTRKGWIEAGLDYRHRERYLEWIRKGQKISSKIKEKRLKQAGYKRITPDTIIEGQWQ